MLMEIPLNPPSPSYSRMLSLVGFAFSIVHVFWARASFTRSSACASSDNLCANFAQESASEDYNILTVNCSRSCPIHMRVRLLHMAALLCAPQCCWRA